MSRRAHPQHDPHLRILIAQSAAQLMVEGGIRDFASAKRKAAERHGVNHSRNMPSNEEIEAALLEYQRIFRQDVQPQQLRALRETAIRAMALLEPFQPRLVGPVLNGSADEHSTVYLHLFAHSAEVVGIFLIEHRIPYEQGERRVQFRSGKYHQFPLFRFIAGDTPIELTIFSIDGERQTPLSPVDGRPMQRARREQVEALLQEG